MSDLKVKVEEVNELLSLDLILDYHGEPIRVESSTGAFYDNTIPFTLKNGEEPLMGRSNFSTIMGFLWGLEWLGNKFAIRDS